MKSSNKYKENFLMFETQDLIAGCKRNEMRARKELYERYAPAMLSLCARYTGNRDTARDVLQDGFYKVFTKIGGYLGEGSFEGWMKRIFVNTALEQLKERQFLSIAQEHENRIEDNNESVFDKLSADDLHRCIAALPGGFRTVFNLHAIEGYSHAEIAEMLHIKEVTSRSQFMRARQLLQKVLSEF